MADDNEMNRIAGEVQVQQARGDLIRSQIEQMQSVSVEINASLEAVRNIKKAKGNMLVPVGAGIFLSCSKVDSEHVIVNIGANVMLQKKPDDALQMLQDRQSKISTAIADAQRDLEAVISKVEKLSFEANMAAGKEEKQNVSPSKG